MTVKSTTSEAMGDLRLRSNEQRNGAYRHRTTDEILPEPESTSAVAANLHHFVHGDVAALEAIFQSLA